MVVIVIVIVEIVSLEYEGSMEAHDRLNHRLFGHGNCPFPPNEL